MMSSAMPVIGLKRRALRITSENATSGWDSSSSRVLSGFIKRDTSPLHGFGRSMFLETFFSVIKRSCESWLPFRDVTV